MNLIDMFFILFAVIVQAIGVILIYDARAITKKGFGFGVQNEATMGLKILGTIMFFIGIFMLYRKKIKNKYIIIKNCREK